MLLEEIRQELQLLTDSENILVLDEVGSTMDEVRKFSGPSTPIGFNGAVLALSQKAGRARQGRSWISGHGDGVYLSALFRLKPKEHSLLGLLPLVIGLELKEDLREYSPSIKLKWPNDLIVQTERGLKKLAGLLLEATHDAEESNVIVGVGVNLRKVSLKEAISLDELSGRELDFAKVSSSILKSILSAVSCFQDTTPKELVRRYNSSMLFFNQQISFSEGKGGMLTGYNRGISEDGSLLLENQSGVTQLYSGEVHQSLSLNQKI